MKVNPNDILLIFPPHWAFNMPYLSLPCLHGALRQAGFEATLWDLNLEFHQWLFSAAGISAAKTRLVYRLESLESQPRLSHSQLDLYRRLVIALARVQRLHAEIGDAAKVFRSEEFYNAPRFLWATERLSLAYRIASTAWSPGKLSFVAYDSPHDVAAPEGLAAAIRDHESNLYLGFFAERAMAHLAAISPRLIGISVSAETQWLPALTLCHVLRQSGCEATVILGGGVPTRLARALQHPDTSLASYCDAIVVGEGEEVMIALASALATNRTFDEVPNLIRYTPRGPVATPRRLQRLYRDLPAPCFHGLRLNEYFSPEPVLPAMLARGCYHRCSFCDHDRVYSRKRSSRVPEQLVAELQMVQATHGASTIALSDESLPPASAVKLSTSLNAAGQRLTLASCFRLEDGWTPESLQITAQGGIHLGNFGLESAVDRVLTRMNKGVSAKRAAEVLHAARDAGLWNHVFVMFGFPGETERDAKETMAFLRRHGSDIHSVGVSRFHLMADTPICESPKTWGVHMHRRSPWSLVVPYHLEEGIGPDLADQLRDRCQIEATESLRASPLWLRMERSQLLLYLRRFGREAVLDIGDAVSALSLGDHNRLPIDLMLVGLRHDPTMSPSNGDSDPSRRVYWVDGISHTISLLDDVAAAILSEWAKGKPLPRLVEILKTQAGCSLHRAQEDCQRLLAELKITPARMPSPPASRSREGFSPLLLNESAVSLFRCAGVPSGLPLESVPEWLAVRAGIKPGMRTTIWGIEAKFLESLADEVRRAGMAMVVRLASHDGFRHLSPTERTQAVGHRPHFLYIARNPHEAECLASAERDGAACFGRALGYPECCIAWLTEQDSLTHPLRRSPNLPIQSASATASFCHAELNNLLWMLPEINSCIYLISHYPCSYDCSSSLVQARRLFALLEKVSPDFSELLQRMLARPVLIWDDTKLPPEHWDENKGIVFDGRVEKNRILYKSYLSLRRQRDFSALAVDWANELIVEPERVIARHDGRLAGCWFSEQHGLPYVLDFRWGASA
jgi:radical SAM superfamily enzyme YgiQ (UPF0313 family)